MKPTVYPTFYFQSDGITTFGADQYTTTVCPVRMAAVKNDGKHPTFRTNMIETERLRLLPLTYGQLTKYILADNSLETELHLNPTSRSISPELKEALEATILPNVADPDKNYLYSTLWTAILKSENKMVGDLCFVGEPNPAGEIEIGYGTYEDFRKQGFMTEAVSGMIGWVQKQPAVRAIVASTDKSNAASWTVLEKNGFVKCGESEDQFNWRFDV